MNELLHISINGEEWREIEEFDGLYLISNFGRIFNVRRGEIKKTSDPKLHRGYEIARFSINRKNYVRQVHRLVAIAFIPNPNNLPQVNHKDEVRNNNNVNNLEWCTGKYNCNYGSRNKKLSERNIGLKKGINITDKHKLNISINSPRNRAVFQYNLDGEFVACFRSTREAARVNGFKSQGPISQNANRKLKQAYKYIWRYKDDEENEYIDNTPIDFLI